MQEHCDNVELEMSFLHRYEKVAEGPKMEITGYRDPSDDMDCERLEKMLKKQTKEKFEVLTVSVCDFKDPHMRLINKLLAD